MRKYLLFFIFAIISVVCFFANIDLNIQNNVVDITLVTITIVSGVASLVCLFQ